MKGVMHLHEFYENKNFKTGLGLMIGGFATLLLPWSWTGAISVVLILTGMGILIWEDEKNDASQ